MNNFEFKEMALFRLVRFYHKGRLIYSGRFYSSFSYCASISYVCKLFGISPDCVTKKVKYLLEIDDLPF